MTLPRSVADVLADHVTLEVECIDRMFLNLYQPRSSMSSGRSASSRPIRASRSCLRQPTAPGRPRLDRAWGDDESNAHVSTRSASMKRATGALELLGSTS